MTAAKGSGDDPPTGLDPEAGDGLLLTGKEQDGQYEQFLGFLYHLYCQVHGIDALTHQTPRGRQLRLRFFQAIARGNTVEELGALFVQHLFEERRTHLLMEPAVRLEVSEHQVAQAQEYIRANLTERLSLRHVARHLHLSREHLARLFRRHCQETVTTYIQRCRVEAAQELMRESSLTLKEIGFKVGFRSYNDFYRNFRKIAGCSPRDYLSERGS